jgi:protein tyrosine phosphatase (PTP) superfamily phosphohydrolase (DUF442 family)
VQALVGAGIVVGALAVHRWAVPVDNFGVVTPGVLYRCPQPTGDDWELLEQYGIRTVINLRTIGEGADVWGRERERIRRAGARMVSIPIGTVLPTDEQIAQFLREIRGRVGPVLIHCEHGEVRTGILAAAYRIVVQDWPLDKAAAEIPRYRCRLRPDRVDGVMDLLRRLRRDRKQWLARTDPDDEWI